MAQGQQFLVLSMIVIVLLIIFSQCNSYPLLNELPVSGYPTKFHSQNDPDRYLNRIKQYYETMAHLRYWRRDIEEPNEYYDDRLQNMLREYENLENKR